MNVREVVSARGVVLVVDVECADGERVATEYLDAGWNVAVTARTIRDLIRIMAGKPAHRFLAIVADPSDRRQADRILDRASTRFGMIDRVVDRTGLVESVWRRSRHVDATA
ncbi:NADP-dependent 3-hydroxy acid dehydrogenase YdfG [Rhodococcus sp. 27YEA15]|uniref:short-chain dehydrogenase n=1 Tax=Rhodococcus sp. 27YEA15 TaxID=3156259 RepID=UPI003C7E472B